MKPGGEAAVLPHRGNGLNLAMDGWNSFGHIWLAGQLVDFLFQRLTPRTRAELDQRRASLGALLPPSASLRSSSDHSGGTVASARNGVIGMHIRGGDACSSARFCPSNLTGSFFVKAAELRQRYGLNRILLATDDRRAAALCRTSPLGFDCRTLRISRRKFESNRFIEHRVASHETGDLSGASVALDVLADIDMLADCDAFVLVFRSAVSRLAYALSLARKGRHTPLASLQWPWTLEYHKAQMKHGKRKAKGGRGSRRTNSPHGAFNA